MGPGAAVGLFGVVGRQGADGAPAGGWLTRGVGRELGASVRELAPVAGVARARSRGVLCPLGSRTYATKVAAGAAPSVTSALHFRLVDSQRSLNLDSFH